MQNPKVIDADGHIYENHEEIEEYFEGKYRGMRRARAYPLFPSLDGWPRGLGAGRPDKVTETRPEDVIKFVDNMGLESTVLYPTAALPSGSYKIEIGHARSRGPITIGFTPATSRRTRV